MHPILLTIFVLVILHKMRVIWIIAHRKGTFTNVPLAIRYMTILILTPIVLCVDIFTIVISLAVATVVMMMTVTPSKFIDVMMIIYDAEWQQDQLAALQFFTTQRSSTNE